MRPGLPGYDCNDGAEESGLCELRFGYAGPGCEVFGGERVLGGESKLCGYVSYEWACGVHSVDTKSEIVKILHFKQFYKHYVFNEDGDGGRKKVLKNYIDVYVCIDMVCGDTKNELESEE